MATQELAERLASHRTIGRAPREEIEWLAAHGTVRKYQVGDVVSRPSEVVGGLFIVMSGHMSIYVDRGAGRRKVMEWLEGDVTGVLPYSRTWHPPGETIIEAPTEVLAIEREDLPELIRNCQEVTAKLVHVMVDRARSFTSTDLRDEKTISLGKLAAGLAHELNNPASAAVRNAKMLAVALNKAEDSARRLGGAGLSPAQMSELEAVRDSSMTGSNGAALSGLAVADREESIGEWLASKGALQEVAEELARTPVTIEALERLSRSLKGGSLDAGLRWIADGYGVRSLIVDIERATSRIHALVAAVKGFTHMDKALDQGPVDIPRGLVDTVALLEGKAKSKSVTIALSVEPGLPAIRGISVEINQIWMNLVDNAIDASPERGHVGVTAKRDDSSVIIAASDDGPGIPAEIKDRIFDPFFTTKSVGEGTGLGLDIVRRIVQWHNGVIDVDSRPGRTEFRVRLPIGM